MTSAPGATARPRWSTRPGSTPPSRASASTRRSWPWPPTRPSRPSTRWSGARPARACGGPSTSCSPSTAPRAACSTSSSTTCRWPASSRPTAPAREQPDFTLPEAAADRMTDLCAGWIDGGTMLPPSPTPACSRSPGVPVDLCRDPTATPTRGTTCRRWRPGRSAVGAGSTSCPGATPTLPSSSTCTSATPTSTRTARSTPSTSTRSRPPSNRGPWSS